MSDLINRNISDVEASAEATKGLGDKLTSTLQSVEKLWTDAEAMCKWLEERQDYELPPSVEDEGKLAQFS